MDASLKASHFLNHTAELDVAKDINVIALVKGEERYVFLFNDETRAETLRTLGRYASNPDMSFSWYDAAVLSQKVRRTAVEYDSEADAEFDEGSVFDDFLFDDIVSDEI